MAITIPFQTTKPEPIYLSCAETAKHVRAALRLHFPGIAFSVKSKTYSGGASISVRWTDGPTYDEVNRVAGAFAGATFDGMIDLKSYHTSELNGQRVRFGSDFVFCARHFSASLIQRATRYANAKYGWTVDASQADPRREHYGLIGGSEKAFETWQYTKADLVYQIARKMRPNGCIVTVK
jgi:hypothetical protein